jgi:uncharacterized damage-inducible protein DinB
MVRTQFVLDSWKTIRSDTAQAVEEFPADDLDFRAMPDLMTFRNLARHCLDAGHALTGLMLAGVDDMAVPEFREMAAKHVYGLPADADGAAIAAALREAVETRTAELAAMPPEYFAGMITRFDGQRITRLEMLQFIKEHELTHRSQMFLCLRLKGLVPATTRRRLAKK